MDDIATIKTVVGDTKNKMSELVDDIKNLKEESVDNKEQIKLVKLENARMSDQIDNLEQYSRKDNLIVNGIPWSQGENLRSLIIKLGKQLKVVVQNYDINTVHRLYGNSNAPAVVARLNNRDLKNDLVRASRKERINANALNFESDQPIYCDDHLTAHNAAILRRAKQLKNDGQLHSVWTSNCTVVVRVKPDDKKTYKINNLEQLNWQQNTTVGEEEMETAGAQTETADTSENQKEDGVTQKRKVEDRSPITNNQSNEVHKKLQLNRPNKTWNNRKPFQPTLDKFSFAQEWRSPSQSNRNFRSSAAN